MNKPTGCSLASARPPDVGVGLLAIEESECDATVLTELDWIISETTIVRPDVLVAKTGLVTPDKRSPIPRSPHVLFGLLLPRRASPF